MLKKVAHLLRRKESTDGSQPRLYAHEEEDSRTGSQPTASLASCLFPDGSNREVSPDLTFGLLKVTLCCAQLLQARAGRPYFAVLSVGCQTLTSPRRRAASGTDVTFTWDASAHFVLSRNGPTQAKVSIYRGGKYKGALNNFLECWCTVDLASFFPGKESDSPEDGGTWVDLLSPSGVEAPRHVGRLKVAGSASSPAALESQLWNRLLTLADFDGDGSLSKHEFQLLIQSFGSELDDTSLESLWRRVSFSQDDCPVAIPRLAEGMARAHSRGDLTALMKRCPVDGAALSPGENLANLMYITLALDGGESGAESSTALKGGYATAQQASRAWMLRMTEWLTSPLIAGAAREGGIPDAITGIAKSVGSCATSTAGTLSAVGAQGDAHRPPSLNTRRRAMRPGHVLVVDRRSRVVSEERLGMVLSLAIRNMYQSRVGKLLMREGFFSRLKSMSVAKGKYMDSPESVKDIPVFLNVFKDDIDLTEIRDHLDSFKTFNQFFYRHLKPGARPVDSLEQNAVIVSCADCRLVVYSCVDEATRFWVKGRRFSVRSLLGDDDDAVLGGSGAEEAARFSGGTMAIFRLAPQDYHRFHAPLGGRVQAVRHVDGQLFTVNPMAVHSEFANVFTENKRDVLVLDTAEFGVVALVAVGATLVGSICWTVAPGDVVAKGDELGYFAFGGSTVILLMPATPRTAWDADLVAYSRKSLEALVRVGERIGAAAGSGLEQHGAAREAELSSSAAAVEDVETLEQREAGGTGMRDEEGLLLSMSPVAATRPGAPMLGDGRSLHDEMFGWNGQQGDALGGCDDGDEDSYDDGGEDSNGGEDSEGTSYESAGTDS